MDDGYEPIINNSESRVDKGPESFSESKNIPIDTTKRLNKDGSIGKEKRIGWRQFIDTDMQTMNKSPDSGYDAFKHTKDKTHRDIPNSYTKSDYGYRYNKNEEPTKDEGIRFR